jgi:putative RecB family exonuclease
LDISNRRLETYLDCPQRYKLLYLDRIHEEPRAELEFSRTVHEALRFLHDPRNKVAPTLDEVVAKYEEAWSRLPEIEGLPEHRSLGMSMLRNYHSAHFPLPEDVLAVEQRFRLSVDGHVLKGIMDRVSRDKGGKIIITDYRTSSTLPTQPDVNRSKQAIIYHHSAQELYPGHPVVVRLHFLKFDFIFETVPAEDAWMEVRAEMLRAVYGIRSGHFPPKPGSICEYCDYTMICPAMRHLFETGGEKRELFRGTDIREAVKEYVELEETIKSSSVKAEELSEKIVSYMEVNRLTRLFVDNLVLSSMKSGRGEWDEKKLAKVLTKLGLLKEILGIRPDRLTRLLQSESLSPQQRKEIESCRDTPGPDVLKYRFLDKDGD